MKPMLGQINLLKYLDSRIVNFEGEDGVFIPLRHNPSIYLGKKGVYANIALKDMGAEIFGNTHMISATLRKETMANMSEAEFKQKTPILGNMRPGMFYSPFDNKKGEDDDIIPEPPKKINDTSVLDKYDDEIEDLPL